MSQEPSNLVVSDETFYMCGQCGFLGWRHKDQGSCCEHYGSSYVVTAVDTVNGVVTIGPVNKK